MVGSRLEQLQNDFTIRSNESICLCSPKHEGTNPAITIALPRRIDGNLLPQERTTLAVAKLITEIDYLDQSIELSKTASLIRKVRKYGFILEDWTINAIPSIIAVVPRQHIEILQPYLHVREPLDLIAQQDRKLLNVMQSDFFNQPVNASPAELTPVELNGSNLEAAALAMKMTELLTAKTTKLPKIIVGVW